MYLVVAVLTVVLRLQVLPLLKAFFVLCEARTAHLPAPAGAASARRAASLDISRGASMDMPELATQPSTALSVASEKAAAEAHLPFLGSVSGSLMTFLLTSLCLRRCIGAAWTACPWKRVAVLSSRHQWQQPDVWLQISAK